MTDTVQMFRALGDETRLRLVRAVLETELSVAELVAVLGLPQSSVSRHLKPLRESGLLECRREATSIYYRRGAGLQDEALERALRAQLAALPGAERDATALRAALARRRRRSREFFDRIAGRYGTLTRPGGGWQALATGLAAGFAGLDVADVGAGEGALTVLLARSARSVAAVDQSPAMLAQIRRRAREAGLADRVRALRGDAEALPLAAAACDAVFLSQVLHHAARPPAAVAEAARVLRPGGRLIVLDLQRHEQAWVRDQLADQWLGFEPDELKRWIEAAGLGVLSLTAVTENRRDLSVLVAAARKRGAPVGRDLVSRRGRRKER